MMKTPIHLLFSLSISGVLSKEVVPDISKDPYVFAANEIPTLNDTTPIWNTRITPTVGNGHISTHLWNDTVYINGLYNGYFGQSHRARIEAQHSMWLTVDGVPENVTKRLHKLDTWRGVFEQTITTPNASVMYRTYAHHYYNRLLVTEVMVQRMEGNPHEVTVSMTSRVGNASEDLKVLNQTSYNGYVYVSAETIIPEFNFSTTVHAYISYTPPDTNITLPANQNSIRKVYLLGADMVMDDDLKADMDDAKAILSRPDGAEQLLRIHTDGWEDTWRQGRIELEGNLEAQKAAVSSFYYLYSSLPSMNTSRPNNMFWALSPGGLANGAPKVDYYGHVFWDMETWMYPGILMFRPDLAKEMLSYRIYSMPPSFDRAREGGYSGTRFPWEAAYTGAEVTPAVCIECRENQQHITGDIAFAAQQYVSATRDINWLTKPQSKDNYTGFQFIREMAHFWASRPTFDPVRQKWEINGVMPPDEHEKSINNSVYTNVGAAYSVNYARYAACLAGKSPFTEVPWGWTDKMKKLVFPYNKEHRYHEEFEGYQHKIDTNTTNPLLVKQADAILLGFPWMWQMPDDVRKNDLRHYERVTNPGGPAMTWGMFSINWLELGNTAEAARLFNKSYQPYIREPFKLWTEAQKGVGAINFITGMGGFLQTLVFGYGGMRLRYEELEFFPPRLPPKTSNMTLYNLKYLGATFDLQVTASGARVAVKQVDSTMQLVIKREGEPEQTLADGNTYNMGDKKFQIYSKRATSCEVPTHFIDVDYGPPVRPSSSTRPSVVPTSGTTSSRAICCWLLPTLFLPTFWIIFTAGNLV